MDFRRLLLGKQHPLDNSVAEQWSQKPVETLLQDPKGQRMALEALSLLVPGGVLGRVGAKASKPFADMMYRHVRSQMKTKDKYLGKKPRLKRSDYYKMDDAEHAMRKKQFESGLISDSDFAGTMAAWRRAMQQIYKID